MYDAYGVISSERLMHPVDLADWPLKISAERQLFVDDYLLASCNGIVRKIHQPVPHAGNPVLQMFEQEWEARDGHSLFVLRDEATGEFKMWYNTRGFFTAENGVRYRAPTGYATSKDGVHWTKPNLGLISYAGSKQNNLVVAQGTIDGLVYDPAAKDPQRRYQALVWHDPGREMDPRYAPREGFYLYWSADGVH